MHTRITRYKNSYKIALLLCLCLSFGITVCSPAEKLPTNEKFSSDNEPDQATTCPEADDSTLDMEESIENPAPFQHLSKNITAVFPKGFPLNRLPPRKSLRDDKDNVCLAQNSQNRKSTDLDTKHALLVLAAGFVNFYNDTLLLYMPTLPSVLFDSFGEAAIIDLVTGRHRLNSFLQTNPTANAPIRDMAKSALTYGKYYCNISYDEKTKRPHDISDVVSYSVRAAVKFVPLGLYAKGYETKNIINLFNALGDGIYQLGFNQGEKWRYDNKNDTISFFPYLRNINLYDIFQTLPNRIAGSTAAIALYSDLTKDGYPSPQHQLSHTQSMLDVTSKFYALQDKTLFYKSLIPDRYTLNILHTYGKNSGISALKTYPITTGSRLTTAMLDNITKQYPTLQVFVLIKATTALLPYDYINRNHHSIESYTNAAKNGNYYNTIIEHKYSMLMIIPARIAAYGLYDKQNPNSYASRTAHFIAFFTNDVPKIYIIMRPVTDIFLPTKFAKTGTMGITAAYGIYQYMQQDEPNPELYGQELMYSTGQIMGFATFLLVIKYVIPGVTQTIYAHPVVTICAIGGYGGYKFYYWYYPTTSI